MTYLEKMQLNIKLSYVKAFLSGMIFIMPIWYVFETQFVSGADLGIIYAVAYLVTVILELPTGALADLLGRKKTIFLGNFLLGLSLIVIGYSQNAIWLWIGYLINGVGGAFVSGADVALDFDSLKEQGKEDEFARFNSKSGLILRLGIVGASLIGARLYSIDIKLPYILMGMAILIGGVLTFWQTEPKIDSEKFSWKNYIAQTKLGIKQLGKSTYIKDLSVYYILIGSVSWYFIYFLAGAYQTEIGFNDLERSYIASVVFLIVALINYFIVRFRIFKKEIVYVIFPILLTIGFVPALWAGKYWGLLLIFASYLASTMRFSLLDQYVNNEFESKYRATAVSALNMMVSLVFAIISILGGRVIGYFGEMGIRTLMTMLGVITLMIAVPTTRVLLRYKVNS